MTPDNPLAGGEQTAPESAPALPSEQTPAAAREGFRLGETINSLLAVLIIAIFIISFIAQEFVIPSPSMESTLLVGDFVLVDKARFAPSGAGAFLLPYRPIQRGDVIVFFYPEGAHEHFVKRVVGLPGDRLRLQGKRLYRNGQLISESYVQHVDANHELFRDNFPDGAHDDGQLARRWRDSIDAHLQNGEVVVPSGGYFVMGDNRDDSLDSRYWGFVPRENILGRPLVIYWSMRMRQSEDDDDAPARPAGVRRRLGEIAATAKTLATGVRFNRFFNVIR